MQADRKLFEDLARMASGAMGAMGGLRGQIRAEIRQRVDSLIKEMDLVTREEFEALKAMVQKTRMEQEKKPAPKAKKTKRAKKAGKKGK